MDKIRIAIVVSEFNKEITYKMLDLARENAHKQNGVTLRYVCYVSGCYDMPLIINELLKRREVDAVITLGAIIKGETRHDELIANSVAKSFIDLSLSIVNQSYWASVDQILLSNRQETELKLFLQELYSQQLT